MEPLPLLVLQGLASPLSGSSILAGRVAVDGGRGGSGGATPTLRIGITRCSILTASRVKDRKRKNEDVKKRASRIEEVVNNVYMLAS